MKLLDALEILEHSLAGDAPDLRVCLACGFTPLHLQTFLAANLRSQHSQHRIEVATGLYGDLTGNIERLEPASAHALVVVVEWGDFDPRLGIRRLGGWRPSNLSDIGEFVERATARLRRALIKASRHVPTVVCMPTLPLPQLFWTPPNRASAIELHLRAIIASLAASLSEHSGIHIASEQQLNEVSPPSHRFDLKSEAVTGFPYSLPHASALGTILAKLIDYRPAKKGLITDLDDTLWDGILGEVGVSGISWHMEQHTHLHGLYQQFIASLAAAGVLIGVASKNDSALVAEAFDRSDLLISRNEIFPFEAHWSPKSESVKRILEAWNVGADSVVFIDDNPMEVAEVKAAFPDLECIVFPKNHYQRFWSLLHDLRGLFGKPSLTEDDSLRLSSIRNSSTWRDSIQSATSSSDDFLKAAEASVTFSLTKKGEDVRAFELINKTNQFNLNGKRLSESEWLTFFNDPGAFLLAVSYEDKYGPLGKIAVLMGTNNGGRISVHRWVMSCRAFSRRIEHQCLRYLFEDLGADTIVLDYQQTPRNGPLQSFLHSLLDGPPFDQVCLSRESFFKRLPPLFNQVLTSAGA